MANKWMSKLQKHEHTVVHDDNYDPMSPENCLQTPSPSLNWAFGIKGHGLPRGDGMLMGGPAKSGKTFIALNMIASLHKADKEAIALIFNSEFRGDKQARPEVLLRMGIDPDRLVIYNTNEPDQIFDFIAKDVNALCQEGAPIKMIVIDSLSAIQGRRFMNQDTVLTQQIGDHASTIKEGLMRILPVYKRHKIGLLALTHVRSEIDPILAMRNGKYKLQAAEATKHQLEFFVYVERNETKDGRKDAFGNELKDQSVVDFMGKAEASGHKIRFKVLDSSYGVRGRTGEFTLNFEEGITNQFEEIANLGVNTGVVIKPNQLSYDFGGKVFKGWDNYLKAVQEDGELAATILAGVYTKDI